MPKPRKEKSPDTIKPYEYYGLDLNWQETDNPTCECPFCGAGDKFSVSVETGVAKCWVCGIHPEESPDAKGLNPVTFIREYHSHVAASRHHQFGKLADERGVSQETIKKFQLAHNGLNWLIPAYNQDRKMCQLYRYVKTENGMKCLPTPTLGVQMFGLNLFKPRSKIVFVCEGLWDTISVYEQLTKDESVIGVPGITTFKPYWCSLFEGKIVVILQDNDWKKSKAGIEGAKRMSSILKRHKKPPTEIRYQTWGSPTGYNEGIKSGADVSDVLTGKVLI